MKLCLRCNQYFEDSIELCPIDTSQLESVGEHPLIGALINDRYVVDSVIGKGSSGIVYKATRLLMGREVAVKVLHSYLGADTGSLDRFLREARAASRLKHPHIINIWESGVTDDAQPYFVMDYLEGVTLADLIKEKGYIHAARTLRIMEQVCEALGEAHRQSIVHRDVKPENIVLQANEGDFDDFVKVLDFGIADQAAGGKHQRQRTAAGSPAYMSPEQCQGFELDYRSDIYSLGIVVFEMLTGERPYNADDVMTLFKMHVAQKPPSLSAVRPDLSFPPQLEAAIHKAIAKKPDQRQQSIKEFQKDLEDALASTDTSRQTKNKTESVPLDSFAVPDSDRLTATTGQHMIAPGPEMFLNMELPPPPPPLAKDKGATEEESASKDQYVSSAVSRLLKSAKRTSEVFKTSAPEPSVSGWARDVMTRSSESAPHPASPDVASAQGGAAPVAREGSAPQTEPRTNNKTIAPTGESQPPGAGKPDAQTSPPIRPKDGQPEQPVRPQQANAAPDSSRPSQSIPTGGAPLTRPAAPQSPQPRPGQAGSSTEGARPGQAPQPTSAAPSREGHPASTSPAGQAVRPGAAPVGSGAKPPLAGASAQGMRPAQPPGAGPGTNSGFQSPAASTQGLRPGAPPVGTGQAAGASAQGMRPVSAPGAGPGASTGPATRPGSSSPAAPSQGMRPPQAPGVGAGTGTGPGPGRGPAPGAGSPSPAASSQGMRPPQAPGAGTGQGQGQGQGPGPRPGSQTPAASSQGMRPAQAPGAGPGLGTSGGPATGPRPGAQSPAASSQGMRPPQAPGAGPPTGPRPGAQSPAASSQGMRPPQAPGAGPPTGPRPGAQSPAASSQGMRPPQAPGAGPPTGPRPGAQSPAASSQGMRPPQAPGAGLTGPGLGAGAPNPAASRQGMTPGGPPAGTDPRPPLAGTSAQGMRPPVAPGAGTGPAPAASGQGMRPGAPPAGTGARPPAAGVSAQGMRPASGSGPGTGFQGPAASSQGSGLNLPGGQPQPGKSAQISGGLPTTPTRPGQQLPGAASETSEPGGFKYGLRDFAKAAPSSSAAKDRPLQGVPGESAGSTPPVSPQLPPTGRPSAPQPAKHEPNREPDSVNPFAEAVDKVFDAAIRPPQRPAAPQQEKQPVDPSRFDQPVNKPPEITNKFGEAVEKALDALILPQAKENAKLSLYKLKAMRATDGIIEERSETSSQELDRFEQPVNRGALNEPETVKARGVDEAILSSMDISRFTSPLDKVTVEQKPATDDQSRFDRPVNEPPPAEAPPAQPPPSGEPVSKPFAGGDLSRFDQPVNKGTAAASPQTAFDRAIDKVLTPRDSAQGMVSLSGSEGGENPSPTAAALSRFEQAVSKTPNPTADALSRFEQAVSQTGKPTAASQPAVRQPPQMPAASEEVAAAAQPTGVEGVPHIDILGTKEPEAAPINPMFRNLQSQGIDDAFGANAPSEQSSLRNRFGPGAASQAPDSQSTGQHADDASLSSQTEFEEPMKRTIAQASDMTDAQEIVTSPDQQPPIPSQTGSDQALAAQGTFAPDQSSSQLPPPDQSKFAQPMNKETGQGFETGKIDLARFEMPITRPADSQSPFATAAERLMDAAALKPAEPQETEPSSLLAQGAQASDEEAQANAARQTPSSTSSGSEQSRMSDAVSRLIEAAKRAPEAPAQQRPAPPPASVPKPSSSQTVPTAATSEALNRKIEAVKKKMEETLKTRIVDPTKPTPITQAPAQPTAQDTGGSLSEAVNRLLEAAQRQDSTVPPTASPLPAPNYSPPAGRTGEVTKPFMTQSAADLQMMAQRAAQSQESLPAQPGEPLSRAAEMINALKSNKAYDGGSSDYYSGFKADSKGMAEKNKGASQRGGRSRVRDMESRKGPPIWFMLPVMVVVGGFTYWYCTRPEGLLGAPQTVEQLEKAGKYEQAIDMLEKQRRPNAKDAERVQAHLEDLYFESATALMSDKNYKEALRELKKISKGSKHFSEARKMAKSCNKLLSTSPEKGQ